MSAGGGTSSQSSRSNSQNTSLSSSMSQAGSFIAPEQAGFLTDMWNQAQGIADPRAATRAASAASRSVLPGMNAAFRNTSALTDPNAQIAAQTDSLQAGLGNLFREEIMPSIGSDAIGAGGFGGGRQGVAEGVAAGQIADSFREGLGDITARANQGALSASAMLPGLASGIFSARTAPTMAGFDPLTALSAILGGPTILNNQVSRSGSMSQGQSSSRSSGSSQEFRFGFQGFGT